MRILAKTRDRKQSGYKRRGSPRAASDGVTIAAPSAARRDNRWSRTRSSTSLKEIQRWWEAFLPVIQEKRDSEHLEFDIWYQWIRHVNSTSGGAAERRNELRVCNRVLVCWCVCVCLSLIGSFKGILSKIIFHRPRQCLEWCEYNPWNKARLYCFFLPQPLFWGERHFSLYFSSFLLFFIRYVS